MRYACSVKAGAGGQGDAQAFPNLSETARERPGLILSGSLGDILRGREARARETGKPEV